MDKETAKKNYGKFKKLEYKQKVPDMHRERWDDGDWTDDSDQMILIMQSLRDNNGKIDPIDFGRRMKIWTSAGFKELGDLGGMGIGATTYGVLRHQKFDAAPCEVDQPDFGRRLKKWSKLGYQELGDFVGMGIGSNTKMVLMHDKFDKAPREAAEAIWEQTGRNAAPNGGVMRTSILGIHDYKNMDNVINNTREICRTTHFDPRCQASCVAVTTAIAMMLQRQPKHMKKGNLNTEAVIADSYQYAKECLTAPESIEELHFHMYAKDLNVLKLSEHRKIGYCFKCMGSGFWALRQKDFRIALEAIVMEAGDADTNGAVAGALLGCKLGLKKLPETWVSGFCHKEWLDQQISGYFAVLDKVLENGAEESLEALFQTKLKKK